MGLVVRILAHQYSVIALSHHGGANYLENQMVKDTEVVRESRRLMLKTNMEGGGGAGGDRRNHLMYCHYSGNIAPALYVIVHKAQKGACALHPRRTS